MLLVAAGAKADNAPPLLKAPFNTADASGKQADWARHLGRQAVEKNSLGERLTLIPPGEFVMGSPDKEAGADDDEHPQHAVKITRPFYLGVYCVTRGQFAKFVAATGYKTDAEKDGEGGWGYTHDANAPLAQRPEFNWRTNGLSQTDEHPVMNVSWNDAVAFCTWLGEQERKKYRLPTDAEWEYACRAGTTTVYFCGDGAEQLGKYAWYSGQSGLGTHEVGQKLPNALGLYDMLGNVWQWCADRYGAHYYKVSPPENPTGPADGSEHVLRGGSWGNTPASCRSADRDRNQAAGRSCYIGFRVAREP